MDNVEIIPSLQEAIWNMNPDDKIALVLPGGGANGRYQFGGIWYTYKIGLLNRVNMVFGTSVGGLNALITAKYKNDLVKGYNMWENIEKNSDIYDGDLRFNNIIDWLGKAKQIFIDNKGKSILKPTGLYKLLERELGGLTLKDLQMPTYISATNVTDKRMECFNSIMNPDFNCATLGKMTSAIPIIFPSVKYEDKSYKNFAVDGGIGRNNPVELAIRAGANKIILIGTYPDQHERKIITDSIFDTGIATLETIMAVFEEFAWDEIDDYNKLYEFDPKHFPKVKFLTLYPKKSGETLNFANKWQMQQGIDDAIDQWTMDKVTDFLAA